MYKVYYKQAIAMLKQNKFISLIAILGSALAIMMIMAIIVSREVRNLSMTPEINRDRILYIETQVERTKDTHGWGIQWIRYPIYENYIAPMQTPELISLIRGGAYNAYTSSNYTRTRGEQAMISGKLRYADVAYWQLMEFTFVEGAPYTTEAFQSGLKQVVLSESMARNLFGGESALNQTVDINFRPYQVVGVVKDVSPAFTVAYGDMWAPYTSIPNYKQEGGYVALLLAKDKADFPKITEEVREAEQRYNLNSDTHNLTLRGPYTHADNQINPQTDDEEKIADTIRAEHRKFIAVLVILLLVPAINLSGLSLSRIKKRTEEIGIRKAFGAKRHTILVQVLYENMITSLIGGVIGLGLSFIVVLNLKSWLLEIPADSAVPIGALVSWPVWLGVFAACLLLNLLSAGIPAYRASKMNIVNSLNQNDN